MICDADPEDSPCVLCVKDECCDAWRDCAMDEDCDCYAQCSLQGGDPEQCQEACPGFNGMTNPAWGPVRACAFTTCGCGG